MPTQAEFAFSPEDDAYLAKMTMDEVGADIETHGHVPVTWENATQDPFTAKGGLAEALDEIAAGIPKNPSMSEGQEKPNELAGEIEGIAEGTKMGEDSAPSTKDSLAVALDSIVEDAADGGEEIVEEEVVEEKGESSAAPKPPKGEEEPDENGLVYITRTFIVDPSKYISDSYRPKNETKIAKAPKNTARAKGLSRNAAEAKIAADEMPPVDYARRIDGSSFLCNDLQSGVDYSKIAMDVSPRRAPTRETCETTFAQCRAQNPLFCRFHGPKLLEADMKKWVRQRLSQDGISVRGVKISVTRDRDAATPNAFRLTVGCLPQQKDAVEGVIDVILNNNPGIRPTGERSGTPAGNTTQEFEMDILRADQPPIPNTKEHTAAIRRDAAVEEGRTMETVGETPVERPRRARRTAPRPEVNQPLADNANNAPPEHSQQQQTSSPQEQQEQRLHAGENDRRHQPEGPESARPTPEDNPPQRPSEREMQNAAIALVNQNVEGELSDAIGGLNGILNGTMQGLGALSAEENQAQMSQIYIDALREAGGHDAVVAALQRRQDELMGGGGETGGNEPPPHPPQEPNPPHEPNPPDVGDTPPPPRVAEAPNEGGGAADADIRSAIHSVAERMVQMGAAGDENSIAAAIRDRIDGRTEIRADELADFERTFGADNPVAMALRAAYQGRQEREAARPEVEGTTVNGIPIPNPDQITIPPANAPATSEEVYLTDRANNNVWNGAGGIGYLDSAKKSAIAAAVSAMNRNPEVAAADEATAKSAFGVDMPRESLFDISTGRFVPAASQQYDNFGCNCWKTVASALCRLRGFNCKARHQNEASPVFQGTPAAAGRQKPTFLYTQKAMAEHYERVNGDTPQETLANIKRMAHGTPEGHPPTLPYPDGTFLSCWSGHHCTGAILYKGKWIQIDPYYGEGMSAASDEGVQYAIFSNADDIGYRVRRALEYYREHKAENSRWRFNPNDNEEAVMKERVLHFMALRREMRKTNPKVTEDEVIETMRHDKGWLDIQGSYVIRPDQPLIKEIFGLAKNN